MNNLLDKFEKLAKSFNDLSYEPSNQSEVHQKHPFDVWNIYPKFFNRVKKLFDDEHYGESTLQACKIIEHNVKRLSDIKKDTGHSLMMNAFNEKNPKICLSYNIYQGDNIQRGYGNIFSGFFSAIRNPAAHASEHKETRDECLEHLIFASFLMRKLDKAEELRVSHPTK